MHQLLICQQLTLDISIFIPWFYTLCLFSMNQFHILCKYLAVNASSFHILQKANSNNSPARHIWLPYLHGAMSARLGIKINIPMMNDHSPYSLFSAVCSTLKNRQSTTLVAGINSHPPGCFRDLLPNLESWLKVALAGMNDVNLYRNIHDFTGRAT